MRAPKFRSVGPTVQPAERKQTHTQTDRHTHTQMDATENITPSANAGDNKKRFVENVVFLSQNISTI